CSPTSSPTPTRSQRCPGPAKRPRRTRPSARSRIPVSGRSIAPATSTGGTEFPAGRRCAASRCSLRTALPRRGLRPCLGAAFLLANRGPVVCLRDAAARRPAVRFAPLCRGAACGRASAPLSCSRTEAIRLLAAPATSGAATFCSRSRHSCRLQSLQDGCYELEVGDEGVHLSVARVVVTLTQDRARVDRRRHVRREVRLDPAAP